MFKVIKKSHFLEKNVCVCGQGWGMDSMEYKEGNFKMAYIQNQQL